MENTELFGNIFKNKNMKAQNRHDTKRWKTKRRDHFGDRCKNSKCFICHSDKIFKFKSIKEKIMDEKLKSDEFQD